MIVTFGEIMMRLAPIGYLRLNQTSQLEMTFGGGEANVAVSLANYNKNARFVTGLPDNDIGLACIGQLRKWNVDTSEIIVNPGRMGIYYCEKGASQRPSKVIYDRAGSAFAKLKSSDFDWSKILKGAKWFHFTGITPALSDGIADATLEACRQAEQMNIPVSCDLNYRKKLWSKEKANKVMSGLMPYVDVLIANEEDANDVFGIKAGNTDVTAGKLCFESYRDVAKQIDDRFGIKKIAVTLRESVSASNNLWSAMLYDNGDLYSSKKYNIQIVDRVGGGDSFAAGLIYGITEGYDCQRALEFATAASCLKHSIEGDFNDVSVSEVEALANGDGSGRVQR